MSDGPPSWSGSTYIDQAICGIGAGVASTIFLQPLDLVKVRFQVATGTRQSILSTLKTIVRKDGVSGLYRGIGVNMTGNCTSWGGYFLFYSMLKSRAGADEPGVKLSAGQHLLCSAESGFITAFLTNPIWVVKTRMFTTSRSQKHAYKGVWDGLSKIAKNEGIAGLYRGTVMALIGVSNGAIQFMAYEELKKRARERKERRGVDEREAVDLSNLEYIIMSGAAKIFAIGLTYPYQVVRSRLQYQELLTSQKIANSTASEAAAISPYTSIRDVVARTYRNEGAKAFYKGITPNVLRVLPGTCVTFVVYENLSALLRRKAEEQQALTRDVQLSS